MTRRGAGFLGLLVVVYLAANYTRVGWLYLITAGLAALLCISWAWSLLALRGVRVTRRVSREDGRPYAAGEVAPCEGEVSLLALSFSGFRFPRLLLRVSERAPARPDARRWFVPSLSPQTSLVARQVWERRGEVVLADVTLETAAPFGLFRTRRTLSAPMHLTVFPRWYPAPDAPGAPVTATELAALPRSGSAGAFLGTREYRTGDPLRAVHWRSSLRRGRLVVKEFEDSAHPALTIALDASRDLGRSPRSSLDDAVRLAASALRWATARGMQVTLAGPDAPRTPVDWRRGMDYLAHVEECPGHDVGAVLNGLPPAPALIVLSPQLGAAGQRAVTGWRRAGTALVVVRMAGYAEFPGEAGEDERGVLRCGPGSDLAVVTALMIGALRHTFPRGEAEA